MKTGLHPSTATAHGGLDHDWIAELFGQLLRFLVGRDRGIGAGKNRHFGKLSDAASGNLVAELVEDIGPGADENDPCLRTGARKWHSRKGIRTPDEWRQRLVLWQRQ